MFAELTKTKDAGKYGVGFFSPDDCDHDTVPCVFNPYPEYKNLKTAYTTTAAPTLTMGSYTAARSSILKCPSNISTDLPVMPTVPTLACSSAQPLCSGAKSNAFKKTPSTQAPKLGEKSKPSNVAETSPSASGSTTSSASASMHERGAMLTSALTATVGALLAAALVGA